jgi:pimeloyl-ACP methyl ester carboxylesterase
MAASYAATPSVALDNDVRLVLTENDDGLTVAVPGTRVLTLQDWIRDLDVIPQLARPHPKLGLCHHGCLTAAEAAVDWLRLKINGRVWNLVGHSLGGGIAVLMAGLLSDVPPARLVTFGAMRSGIGDALSNLLKPVPGMHYCHSGDPVPGLPIDPYAPWRTPTSIGMPEWWPADIPAHYMTAYMAALSRYAIANHIPEATP